jgi:AAA family ATP:ADP antiporter
LFWSYSNDIYSDEQGRRLFPYIGIGASLGGFFGAMTAKKLATLIEPHTAMLTGAAILAVAVAMLSGVRQYVDPQPAKPVVAETSTRFPGGFRLVAADRYLMLIAAVVVLTNVVNTTGEFIIGKTVVEASKAYAPAMQKQFISSFYADYYMLINLGGAVIQALAVAPIFKRFGAGGALMILPMVAVSGYAAIAVLPMIWLIRATKIAENTLDYSLQNTAKHALFLPTSQEVKYKAKATIDSFFFRFGDLIQAGLVMMGSALAFSPADYAKLNAVVALLWLGTAALTAREYRRRTAPVPEPVRLRRPRPEFRPVSVESAC